MLHDGTTIYFGFICYDSEPDKIIVSQARRDSTLTDTDAIIFVLDTFNDRQNAFVFGTNPLGIEYDGQVAGEGQTSGSSGGGAPAPGQQSNQQRGNINAFNPNWDGNWTVKAQVTERGWEAEVAIPFKTLRYLPGVRIDNAWGQGVAWRSSKVVEERTGSDHRAIVVEVGVG